MFAPYITAKGEEQTAKLKRAPKKKNARGKKKKKDHTTSSGKGPFSGPLVCRLLSRPNRVPIHTSRAWCMMHALKRSPSLPLLMAVKVAPLLPAVGDNSPQRRNSWAS